MKTPSEEARALSVISILLLVASFPVSMGQSDDISQLIKEVGSLRAIVIILSLVFCLFMVAQFLELLFQVCIYKKRLPMGESKPSAIEPAPEIVIQRRKRKSSNAKKRKVKHTSNSREKRQPWESEPSKKAIVHLSLSHDDVEEALSGSQKKATKGQPKVTKKKEERTDSSSQTEWSIKPMCQAIPKDSLRVASPAHLIPLADSGDDKKVPVPETSRESSGIRDAIAIPKDSLMQVSSAAPLIPVPQTGSDLSGTLSTKSAQDSSGKDKNNDNSRGDLSVEVSGSAEARAILNDQKAAEKAEK
uniref:Transmembrane protein n=1 Tax=Ascaris lumbricoides TaxID=6252 RepID=A0A0M3HQP3_ASCLU